MPLSVSGGDGQSEDMRQNDRSGTMRAISQDELGGPEVLKEVELERPQPGPGEILVKVRAAGLNPTDWKHRRLRICSRRSAVRPGLGRLGGRGGRRASASPCTNRATRSSGCCPYPHGAGSHAEYVTSPARVLVRKPAGLDTRRGGRTPAGRTDRLAGARRHRRTARGTAGADPCRGGRRRTSGRADRQGHGRTRDRHGERGQARDAAEARRRRADRLPRDGLRGGGPGHGRRARPHRQPRPPHPLPAHPQARRHDRLDHPQRPGRVGGREPSNTACEPR